MNVAELDIVFCITKERYIELSRIPHPVEVRFSEYGENVDKADRKFEHKTAEFDHPSGRNRRLFGLVCTGFEAGLDQRADLRVILLPFQSRAPTAV